MSKTKQLISLPPLNALHAFEVVARTRSVRAAAGELFVTPGAVSRQIHLLEEHVGVPLFMRVGRGLVLTEVGAAYQERIAVHFDGLRQATALLRGAPRRSVLRLRSYTTFATRWLIPRLTRFQIAHPEVDVRLTTASEWGDLGDFDAAIRLGDGKWRGLSATPLVPNVLVPVCSPSLVGRDGTLDLARLVKQTIFIVRARHDDWQLWCDAAGLDMSRFKSRRGLESSALAYQAAADGHGVAIAQRVLVVEELRSGALVAPVGIEVDRSDFTYHLVMPRRAGSRTTNGPTKPLAELRDWLLGKRRRMP